MSNRLLVYKDPVILIETAVDGYGDPAIGHIEYLNGLFVQGTSQSHGSYVDSIGTDAHIYLDIENPYVKENAYRLEDMYIIANLFGFSEDESWYKISRVKVGQRKLLENDINNVHCFLQKNEKLFDIEES